MKKVVVCGTHPKQYNGYSKVVYHLCKELSKHSDVELYVFGFQNIHNDAKRDVIHSRERDLSYIKEVYDVLANESPRANGFGESLIVDYLNRVKPDIVIIYNDLVVISSLVNKIREIENRSFKVVPYIDIVYPNQKNNMFSFIANNIDGAFVFSEYWKSEIQVHMPESVKLHVVKHGFDTSMYYPIPKRVARLYFGISPSTFVILNLNRNQVRKRWDICIMAYVRFIKNHMNDDVKLMIATDLTGGWDLVDLMTSECRKAGISLDDFTKHLVVIDNAQRITDRDINVMYNVSDIGINTCDGEGFGLCNFEQAGIGAPQVVPKVGGFMDFFNSSNSVSIKPQWSYYSDSSRDSVSGEAHVCSVQDFADGLEYYYNNRSTIKAHGEKARANICSNYTWKSQTDKMYDVICSYCPEKESTPKDNSVDASSPPRFDSPKEPQPIVEDKGDAQNRVDMNQDVDIDFDEIIQSKNPTPAKKKNTAANESMTPGKKAPLNPVLRNMDLVNDDKADDDDAEIDIDKLVQNKLNSIEKKKEPALSSKTLQLDNNDDEDDDIVVEG